MMVGAEQLSGGMQLAHPLTESEVGPAASDERGRPLISAPAKVTWISAKSD
jgi:hypothetical protein